MNELMFQENIALSVCTIRYPHFFRLTKQLNSNEFVVFSFSKLIHYLFGLKFVDYIQSQPVL
jgi:hypothetical protein